MKRQQWISFLCFFLSFHASLLCASTDNRYSATLFVPNQSLQTRDKALTITALKVLRQVSGNERIGELHIIKKALSHSSLLVKTYTYEPAPSEAQQPWRFHVDYDVKAIDQLINLAKANTAPQPTPSFVALEMAPLPLKIVIDNIHNEGDYLQVSQYLQSIPGISDLFLATVTANQIRFTFRWLGAVTDLQKILENDKLLSKVMITENNGTIAAIRDEKFN